MHLVRETMHITDVQLSESPIENNVIRMEPIQFYANKQNMQLWAMQISGEIASNLRCYHHGCCYH